MTQHVSTTGYFILGVHSVTNVRRILPVMFQDEESALTEMDAMIEYYEDEKTSLNSSYWALQFVVTSDEYLT